MFSKQHFKIKKFHYLTEFLLKQKMLIFRKIQTEPMNKWYLLNKSKIITPVQIGA